MNENKEQAAESQGRRPTEPRTAKDAAIVRLLRWMSKTARTNADYLKGTDLLDKAAVAIEAEAAQGAAPPASPEGVIAKPWSRDEWEAYGMGYRHGRDHESIARESERSAPRAEGLDVEPLIRLVRLFDGDYNHADLDLAVNDARAALDNARLSRPSDERVPAADPRDDPSNYDVHVIEAALDADERVPESEERPVCKRFRHDEHCIDEPHA